MTTQPEKPVDRYLVKPDLDGIVALFERLTGKKVDDAKRAELEAEFGDRLPGGQKESEPPTE
jgi:hypothetical protein